MPWHVGTSLCHLWGVRKAPGGSRGASVATPELNPPNLPRAAKSRRSVPLLERATELNCTHPRHRTRRLLFETLCYSQQSLRVYRMPYPPLMSLRDVPRQGEGRRARGIHKPARTPHPAHSAGMGGQAVEVARTSGQPDRPAGTTRIGQSPRGRGSSELGIPQL